MMDYLINGNDIQKTLFVTLIGMLGVFIVLILFYFIIRLFSETFPVIGKWFTKVFSRKQEENNN